MHSLQCALLRHIIVIRGLFSVVGSVRVRLLQVCTQWECLVAQNNGWHLSATQKSNRGAEEVRALHSSAQVRSAARTSIMASTWATIVDIPEAVVVVNKGK